MAGRAFAFADPEIVTLASTAFVPVCTDDWYTRRRDDAEGTFFRAVSDQGSRKASAATGGTRQGIYAFTADGELLAFKNAGQDADATRDQLKLALRKWAALPAARRGPGRVTVPPHGPLDPKFSRTPPADGLVAKVYARILDRKGDGYTRGTCGFAGGDRAARDHLWLTADEVATLAPAKAEVGHAYPVPAAVADRVVRFHLVDNTRGEPTLWGPKDVRSSKLTLTVTAATDAGVELRLDGAALLATDANPAKADRGYDVRLRGDLRWVPAAKRFDRFDVVAVGDHWGDGTHTQTGTRPGRGPLGVLFALADPDVPADRVPPQGARDRTEYFGK